MENKYKEFIKFIINSEGSDDYRHHYIEINGKKTDILEDGWWSCAFYVSSILKKFNSIWKVHCIVRNTVIDMISHGWYPTRKLNPGNVIVWDKQQSTKDSKKRPPHIGFYLGEEKVMSHRSLHKSPMIHHYTYGKDKDGNPKRKIKLILTHSFVRKGIEDINEEALIEIREDNLKISYKDYLWEKQEKKFPIMMRKGEIKDINDLYGQGCGPVPPGDYYAYFRIKNNKTGNRLEFCQKKPKKFLRREIYILGINILNPFNRGTVLKFKDYPNRKNIQIHGYTGKQSAGCIILNPEDERKLYSIVWSLFERGINVKVKVDDYWETQKGKEELKNYDQRM